MSRVVHEAPQRGFGAAPEAYARSRPDYAGEAIDRLVQELEVTRSCRSMDLGAGTGKLTRLLVPPGATLVAVGPVAAMRRAFAPVQRHPDLGGREEFDLPYVTELYWCAKA